MCAMLCGHGLSQLCGLGCNLAVCLLSFINVSFRAASYLAEGAACNGNDEVVAKGRRWRPYQLAESLAIQFKHQHKVPKYQTLSASM